MNKINSPTTKQCAISERSMLKTIGGNCDTAVGALATVIGDEIKLTVNPNDFSLKAIEKKVHEGNWKKNYSAVIDSNLNIVNSDIVEWITHVF